MLLFNKALMVNPEERYKNAIEMMNDLSDIDNNLDWVFTGNMSMPYTKCDSNYRYVSVVKILYV